MMGNIFNKRSVTDFINAHRKALLDRIDSLEILSSTNSNFLIESLKTEFTIYPIELKKPMPSEPQEAIRHRKDELGETYQQKVFDISVTIPFEGNKDLFDCYPNPSTVVYLDKGVTISKNIISATITLENLDESTYHTQLNRIIDTLSSNLPSIQAEINPWNSGLETLISQSLEKRKDAVASKHKFMEKIGLNINPKSKEYLTPSVVTKKVIPTPATDTTKNMKREVIPFLQNEVYEDIKEVLYNVGQAIERKPSIYDGKCEEDLRDIFLLFLETRYDSTSGVGEAFNKKGKTDILLKYANDGSNIFVAECKFWKGKKSIISALSQLLRYLTHRDSKTALIMFVKQKKFTEVITTIKSEIKNHPQFHRHIKDTYEHSFGYEFVLPGDAMKCIQVEVMCFYFPE